MILSHLQNAQRIEELHPRFKEVFDYLRSHDLLQAECGRIELDGDRLFINNAETDCKPADEQLLEVHRDYIDIQLLLEGSEIIGWKSLDELEQEVKPYDAQADIAFYADRPSAWLHLHPGQFAVFFPEDAHAPVIGEGRVRKAVVKIRCR